MGHTALLPITKPGIDYPGSFKAIAFSRMHETGTGTAVEITTAPMAEQRLLLEWFELTFIQRRWRGSRRCGKSQNICFQTRKKRPSMDSKSERSMHLFHIKD